MEEELVKVVNSIPRAEFLRIARRLSRDFRGSANDMDLCTSTQVVHVPIQTELRQNEVQGPNDDPLVNDLKLSCCTADRVATVLWLWGVELKGRETFEIFLLILTTVFF